MHGSRAKGKVMKVMMILEVSKVLKDSKVMIVIKDLTVTELMMVLDRS